MSVAAKPKRVPIQDMKEESPYGTLRTFNFGHTRSIGVC
jgi:hypothetical protein